MPSCHLQRMPDDEKLQKKPKGQNAIVLAQARHKQERVEWETCMIIGSTPTDLHPAPWVRLPLRGL
eukprot:2999114-Amphidinium_carterae.1